MNAQTAILALAHAVVLLTLPFVVVGVIQRTKALWAGRKSPRLFQLAYDVVRLLRKRSVYSEVTTYVFRVGPYVVLVTALVSGMIVPILGARTALGFPFDFVWFAYVWGLGRVALMLGALDTGSAFEGMGASREATFSAILEPALFLVGGATCLVTHERSFDAVLALRATTLSGGAGAGVLVGSVVALFILVQVESARLPVDDPTTHLELTMVHEVMILDHSGPELAALQVGSAIKLTVGLALVAALLNPLTGRAGPLLAGAANVALCLLLAVAIGTVESLVARWRMRSVPQYIVVALIAAGVALLATTWQIGGAG
jgi:formate hydrogenlyase subunit 4